MTAEYEGVIRLDSADDVPIIEVSGEADLRTTRKLRATLDELAGRPAARVLVDLTGATFIDSSTLGALAFCARAFADRPRQFAVVCAPGEIREMFALTALERIVPLYDSREEALLAIRQVSGAA